MGAPSKWQMTAQVLPVDPIAAVQVKAVLPCLQEVLVGLQEQSLQVRTICHPTTQAFFQSTILHE
eukprot:3963899-Amphidinium_carterae.1